MIKNITSLEILLDNITFLRFKKNAFLKSVKVCCFYFSVDACVCVFFVRKYCSIKRMESSIIALVIMNKDTNTGKKKSAYAKYRLTTCHSF